MKNLLYKEFRLSIHPLTYFFMALMALVCFSPGLPVFVPLLYFAPCYTFLFIGMNKTTTTNDLFYTCNLPIRRKDVVTARICSTTVLQLVEILLVFPILTLTMFGIVLKMPGEDMTKTLNSFVTIDITHGIYLAASYLICFVILDLIYLPWFYKTGRSIILNMFVSMIAVMAVGALLTVVPHYIPAFEAAIKIGTEQSNYFLQFGILLAAIALWIGSKFLVRYLCAKNLVRLDF